MPIGPIVFALSTATLLYVLFGYPLLLAAIRRARPVRRAQPREWKTVTIILPVRNGERWIRNKLESLLALDYPRDRLQILVVSDNSVDSTIAIANEFKPVVQVLRNPHSGKATAINEALRHAEGEILFFTDVRQPIETTALKRLVACFEDPEVGVASGELIIRAGNRLEEANVGLYWKYEKWIRNRHSRIDSVIGATGAIYAMRRALAAPLPANTLLDDVHLPVGAFLKGFRVIFVPEAKAWDDPTALDTEFRRKVRTVDTLHVSQGRPASPALCADRDVCIQLLSAASFQSAGFGSSGNVLCHGGCR
jgi:poly-beta-1,6-N-acetyl-D-glucosamine synthase